jgi:hypothetical protein
VKQRLTELDKGRLHWCRPSKSGPAYLTVLYRDDANQLKSVSAGLRVPRLSLAGESLSEAERFGATMQLLKKARREWNRLDKAMPSNMSCKLQ